jgi:hypothetical protein
MTESPVVKKLTKHGNSLALVIDRPILDLLRIEADTPLEVSTDGRQLFVAPVQPSARRKKFDEAQERAHKQFSKAFQELAE